MTNSNQPPLFDSPEPAMPPDPTPERRLNDRASRVYLASTLTRLQACSPDHTRMVESEVEAIKSALDGPRFDGGIDLAIDPYVPLDHSSAHRHVELTPQQVFRMNSLEVLTRSDGFIVHGWEPGAGVGQEFTWAATQVAIPVLWLRHEQERQPISRQILGAPGDVEFSTFEDPGDLRSVVEQWLRSRKAVLAAGPYRRSTRSDRWRGPAAAARTRWQALDEREQDRICATGNIVPQLVDFYLSDPLLMAVAPAWILDVLTVEGLLVSTSATHNSLGRLSTAQLLSLSDAAAEYEWDVGLVDRLRVGAEQVLAEPATRRFRLETPADWLRFLEALGL